MAASIAVRRLSLAQPRVLRRKGFEPTTVAQHRFKGTQKPKKELPLKIEKPKLSEKFLQKRPLHSVYMLKDYPQQYFSFEECADMHKEAAQAWMLDSLNNRLFADIQLDLTTKKQTKFLPEVRGVIGVPNKFDTGRAINVAVITDDKEEQKQAEELGASTVADSSFVKQVNQGMFDKEDINYTDFFICHRNLAHSMSAVRNKLQLKTPSTKTNTLVTDVIETLKFFLSGVMYESKKISQSQAVIRIPVGQLYMETKALEENFQELYLHLAKSKPAGTTLSPYVDTVTLVAPPSQEVFHVRLNEYLQQYTSSQKQKPGKQEADDMDEDAEEE